MSKPLEHDPKHVIGNKVFAIETNLQPLRTRIERMKSHESLAAGRVAYMLSQEYAKNVPIAKECEEILASIERSLEEIKQFLPFLVDWDFDPSTNTWFYNTKDNGCGVFFDDNKWSGNVIYKSEGVMMPQFETKQEAMMACLKELFRLRQMYDG